MVCTKCKGSGKCPDCHGSGGVPKNPPTIRKVTRRFATGALNPDGTRSDVTHVEVEMQEADPVGPDDFVKCPACQGTGKCPSCGGTGES